MVGLSSQFGDAMVRTLVVFLAIIAAAASDARPPRRCGLWLPTVARILTAGAAAATVIATALPGHRAWPTTETWF